ncbi:Crp/Fnr family transcriptional regulator [Enterovirga aerilata]|uniref:Crp/Fnr family transcriptional regulator n=1 Tax=Enterovirga aerilata TaxID=2730920 RepID=A0A849I6S3_9HYPH|nr:Crp/Fnr family transcriptional regulator [Enterovirga sp. DB1703]NNM75182.1 Crp/Fnr family transcriptional regulator [Enterovirga sp. DB1703]
MNSAGSSPGADALVRKLDALSPLTDQDAATLERVVLAHARHARPREDLICEGDRPGGLRMILSGWACRYKMLEDGRRQILAFLLPGDSCDFNMRYVPRMDHSVAALTTVAYAELAPNVVDDLISSSPSVARALLCETISDASIQREWTVNLGQRVALERLAHLFCEIFVRLRLVGLASGNTCVFPPTQADLAAAVGLSDVHVNRTLQELRRAGLVELSTKSLTIPSLSALQAAALFEPGYLHLRHDRTESEASVSPHLLAEASPRQPESRA